MKLNAVNHKGKMDWESVKEHRASDWDWNWSKFEGIEPLLSATDNSHYRLIGMTGMEGNNDIHLIRPKIESNESRRDFTLTFDIWHNTLYCQERPIPRLVVFDNKHIWIFADIKDSCKLNNNLYIPAELMQFDYPNKFENILLRPMHLFYLDKEKKENSGFHMPRIVSRNPELLLNQPHTVVAYDAIHIPKDRVFKLEAGTFTPVAQPAMPNLRCHFSSTNFFMTIFENTPNLIMKYCRKYSLR